MRGYLGTRSVAPDVVRVSGVLPIPLRRRLWPLALAFAVVLWDCVAVNLDWCAKYCGETVPDPRLFCQLATSGLFKARVA